jgi:hypothetical protein
MIVEVLVIVRSTDNSRIRSARPWDLANRNTFYGTFPSFIEALARPENGNIFISLWEYHTVHVLKENRFLRFLFECWVLAGGIYVMKIDT